MSEVPLVASDGEIKIPKGVYPLNADTQSSIANLGNQTLEVNYSNNKHIDVYPDFKVWKQEQAEDVIMQTCLQKGYSISEYVKHEEQSGRHLFTDILDKPKTDSKVIDSYKSNKMSIMGQMFVDAMHKRRLFNVIRSKGAYKPPPRVTLTEHKKEAWIKKLSDPQVPLKDLSRAIPHGLRNKHLFEQCLQHQVPIPRAIWLIKCIATNEQRQLKRKTGANSVGNSSVAKWIAEWTEQITSFSESVMESCFQGSLPKETWKYRLDYTIELITNLYSEDLMNRVTFLTWIVRYTTYIVNRSTSFTDMKCVLAHQIIIKLFWFKIIQFDYLTKELSESMLLLLVKANQLSKGTKFETLASKISAIFQELIKYLFYFNSDIFIIPGHWNVFKPYLKNLLDMDLPPVNDQFKLIAYRNESLTNDEFDRSSNFGTTAAGSAVSQNVFANIPSSSAYDEVSAILYKLNNTENESILSLSKIVFEEFSSDSFSNWKNFLHIIFQWSIRAVEDPRINLQKITLICSVIQFRASHLLQIKSKRYKQFRSDLENTITDFIYMMSEILNYNNKLNPEGFSYDINSFLLLVNKLSAIKLFSVSSYLRRLIASGVIYLSEPDRTCYIHILILNSLPATNDPNLKSILKRLMDSTNFKIEKIDINPIKLNLSNFLSLLLDGKFARIEEHNNFDFQSDSLYIHPEHIGKHVELGEFLYAVFDTVVKTSDTIILLTNDKLIQLYKLFEEHPVGLAKFLLSILDLSTSDNARIQLTDKDTLLTLLKLIIFNSKLLKSSIYDMKSSVWDSCLLHMVKLKKHQSFELSECLLKSQAPLQIMQEFQNLNVLDESIQIMPDCLTQEECQLIDVPQYERLENSAEFFHTTSITLTKYSNILRSGEDIGNFRLFIKYLKSLQVWKLQDFSKCLNDYIYRAVKENLQLDYVMCMKILQRLVVDGILDIRTIIMSFDAKIETNDLFETRIDTFTLYWNLLFREDNMFSFNFSEKISYRYALYTYKMNYVEEYYKILSQICFSSFYQPVNLGSHHVGLSNVSNTPNITVDVSVNPVDVGVGVDVGSSVDPTVDVDVINTFREIHNGASLDSQREPSVSKVDGDEMINWNVVSAVQDLVSSHNELFIELFYSQCDNYRIIDFEKLGRFVFKDLLRDEFGKNDQYSKIEPTQIIDRLNYFNLPILQWLFTIYVAKNFEDNDLVSSERYVRLIEQTLQNVDMTTSHYKLLGELFVHLSDDLKVKILLACEEVYLNNESFPRVMVDGNDVTKLLSCIISSCLRKELFANGKNAEENDFGIDDVEQEEQLGEKPKNRGAMLEMNNALVFSLNSALEKLIYTFNSMEHSKTKTANKLHIPRDLEFGIKMIARIILLHKYFLVELILKRSVSLQRDVLIMNLMKLFNHRVMNKNPKLKNLLYDVLISIKVIISESITEKFQRSQSLSSASNQPAQAQAQGAVQVQAQAPTQTSAPAQAQASAPPAHNASGTSRLVSPNGEVSASPMPIPMTMTMTMPMPNLTSVATPTNIAATSMVSSNSPSAWIATKNMSNNMNFSPMPSPKPSGSQGVTGLSFLGESNNMLQSTSGMSNLPLHEEERSKSSKNRGKNSRTTGGSGGGAFNNGAGYLIMPNILNVKPPSFNNNLKSLLTMFDLKDTVPERKNAYYTVNQSWNGTVPDDEPLVRYNLKPFELIEESCAPHAPNDCAINLALFGMSVKRENMR